MDRKLTHTIWLIPELNRFEVGHLLLSNIGSFDSVLSLIELTVETLNPVSTRDL